MEEESDNWGISVNKLLVRCRLDMEAESAAGRKKKSVLWGKVLVAMKEVNPNIPHSKEVLQRKFLNLLASYKRIKKRNNESGRGATCWEYFEGFDSVYGTRHSIQPPDENLQSTLENFSPVIEECDAETETVSEKCSARKRPKPTASETLDFFKEEALREQKRHDEVVELEREKLAAEKEKIGILADLRNILEKRA